jgi:hypothetical protein
MSWESELQNFIPEIEQSLGNKDRTLMELLGGMEQNCFSQAGDDMDRFVKCMSSSMKKINKEDKKFEFRMAFFQMKTSECFKNNYGNADGLNKCKTQAKQNLDNYFKAFTDGLK